MLLIQAKTPYTGQVLRKTNAEAKTRTLKGIRWAETDGEPVSSHCGSHDACQCRGRAVARVIGPNLPRSAFFC